MSTITIGIFETSDEAQRAIDELVKAGVAEGDLHPVSRQRIAAGEQGVLGPLSRAVGFGTGAVSHELTRLGVDQEEAAFYEDELAEESLLLAVETTEENEEKVMSIMREANATFRES